MTVLLLSPHLERTYGDELRAVAAAAGLALDILLLPDDPDARLTPEQCATIEGAFFSGDIFPRLSRSFFSATQGAANLRWVHVFNAGVDNAVFRGFINRGVTLTTSSGSTAKPIAQTAIGGMMMLSRGFLEWGESQRRKAWEPRRGNPPVDLDAQTMVVLGLGAIGNEIARISRAIGLHVIGLRRSPRRDGDHVDEMVHPSQLLSVLRRADWLALACPLTEETRRIINAAAIAALPRGARILNVARGEVVDEEAMIEALRSGHLGGAYLDVVWQEPLPPESPLWEMPNVIITPHNSSIASGNERRAVDFFLTNLRAWGTGDPMVNVAV